MNCNWKKFRLCSDTPLPPRVLQTRHTANKCLIKSSVVTANPLDRPTRALAVESISTVFISVPSPIYKPLAWAFPGLFYPFGSARVGQSCLGRLSRRPRRGTAGHNSRTNQTDIGQVIAVNGLSGNAEKTRSLCCCQMDCNNCDVGLTPC